MSRGRRAAAVRLPLLALLLTAGSVACGDGTPAFCESLESIADLDSLSQALGDEDLETARAEALRFADLAQDAPAEIRSDLGALADAVTDIVELLEQDSATTTEAGGTGSGASEVERRRDDLNARFGELGERGTRVSTWAAHECGIDL